MRRAARRAVEIAGDERFRMRRIVNEDAIHNAMVVDMAMGGSSNTVLHMLAIAREAGVAFDLRSIEEIAKKVAHIAKIAPSLSTVHMEDIHRAGGVPAVLKEVARRGDVVRERRPHRHRRDHRRADPGRGDQGPRGDPHDRDRLLAGGRPRRPVRQPRPRGRGREDRRHPAVDAQVHRQGDLLRLAGRRHRRDHGRQGEGGPLRGDPLRGAEGRAGHAGDARAHRAHHGDGPRRRGRARHRRPLLRRDPRRLRRPRLARRRPRAAPSRSSGTATRSRSTSRRAPSRWTSPTQSSPVAASRSGRRRRRSAPPGFAATRTSSRTPRRAR